MVRSRNAIKQAWTKVSLAAFVMLCMTGCDEECEDKFIDERYERCVQDMRSSCRSSCDVLNAGDEVCLAFPSPCDAETRSHMIDVCYDACGDTRRVDVFQVSCEFAVGL